MLGHALRPCGCPIFHLIDIKILFSLLRQVLAYDYKIFPMLTVQKKLVHELFCIL